MKQIIVYGIEGDKLWFGRPTLRSWLNVAFKNGYLLEVKPIKGYEEYAYYPDHLFVGFEYCSVVTLNLSRTPKTAIYRAERYKGNKNVENLKPIHGTLKSD
jgi:hypothetical protein